MPRQTHRADSPPPAGPHATTLSKSRRKRHNNRLISLVYALGLLLIFILSLLLLPADTGLGKLLWSSLSAGN